MEQTLGKRIMANRKRLGLTQDQLAEQLGVTAQAVSKWENDQSCPDIAMLPRLAGIFGITTDSLLGYQEQERVYEAELVPDSDAEEDDSGEPEGVHCQYGNFDFSWNSGKKAGLGFALTVLLVGALYLVSEVLEWNVGFWEILWPSALFIYGVSGIYPKFSVFRCGCAAVGGYYLVTSLFAWSPDIDGGIIFAAAILLFGISLLADVFRKPNKRGIHLSYTDKDGKRHTHKSQNNYQTAENAFTYNGSFGEVHQLVCVKNLQSGDINTSFGEYVLDLSGVEKVAADCAVQANCSFGELTLLIPDKYIVIPDSSTSFAGFTIKGQPRDVPEGQIRLDANASFGEITVRYI